jgi:SAM-dependent methyltransferase
MAEMSPSDFEARHRDHTNPWDFDFERSDYEHAKYEATLVACGEGPFTNAVELGGSIGVFTERLAPRCVALTTVDVARTAAAMARRRLAHLRHVRVIHGTIPDAAPDEKFDLVVASEILCHLSADELERTLAVIRARLVRGGRLVAVHWRPSGPERLLAVGELHARLRDDPWFASIRCDDAGIFLLDALDRR